MLAPPLHSQLLYVLCTLYRERSTIYFIVKAHSQHTIGVEFSSRTVKLGEKRIKLQVCQSPPLSRSLCLPIFGQLWDTAGQERFRSVGGMPRPDSRHCSDSYAPPLDP